MGYTYCNALKLLSNEPLTQKKICKLCDQLNEEFGLGYIFEPEPISEGGIILKNWPGKKDHEYKTFRFWKDYGVGKWPWICNNIIQKWLEDDDKIIFDIVSKPSELYRTRKEWLDSFDKKEEILLIHLFLKTLYSAPCWTCEELNKIEKCFKTIGFIQIGKYPKNKLLYQDDENLY